jgi:uncharacterized protein (DUF362 family)/NAD-dependent dihydropyrimidine dehydrogenase PreA subunit
MHRVLIHPAEYDKCRAAVERAFELFPLDIRGKKVLVKPNALRASDADQAIVTNPAVVRTIVEKLESLGAAEIIVGDNPGMMSYGDNEKTFRQSGLMAAAAGHYRNIGTEAREVPFNPEFIDRVSVSSAVLDADVVISVPKFKTHGLTVVTGAIKNSYGILPGAQKANLHRIAGNASRFSEMVVDVYRLRVPDLIIVDAVVGMEGNGPASTDLRHIGCILASDNGVAIDATIARMMGADLALVPFLGIAQQRGLGRYDAAAIDIIGKLAPIPHFQLPARAAPSAQDRTTVDFATVRARMRPKADEEKCTACGTCVDQCPVSALTIADRYPVVDAERCIACFCCQEMCPEQAIKLS